MTTTEQALRLSVLHNPDDDLPRLVYADWLEENGQEGYAHFIRWQIRGDGGECPWGNDLIRANFNLIGGATAIRFRKDRSLVLFERVHGRRVERVVVRRGFVAAVEFRQATFLGWADNLFPHEPVADVLLIDRDPAPSGIRGMWVNYGGTLHNQPYHVDPAIWCHLPDAGRTGSCGVSTTPELRDIGLPYWVCDDPYGSRDALSAAALAYGRTFLPSTA
jgi:uncharacterized protein (TIGR02996 family)